MAVFFPNFHGCHAQNARDFMDSLEMAHLMVWCDQEEVKLRAFPLVLKGETHVWYDALAPPSKAIWPTLYGSFLNKYGHGDTLEDLWKQLLQHYQESTSALLQEFKTSSYYEEEKILCWCVRYQGTYRRPRRECRSHESEYGVVVDAPAPSQQYRPMALAYDMEADVPLLSHMHGTSQMLDEYMRLLCKSNPKIYHKFKKQYEMDFDKAHEDHNKDNDMDDNDMDEFINDWYAGDHIAGARATMRQECSGFWYVDSSKPLQVTREPYILLAHYEQAFFYVAPDSNSPWRQVVPINPRGRRIFDTTYMEADQDTLHPINPRGRWIFDTTYMEADQDTLHKDELTSTKPLQLTTLAQEEPQEEAKDDNDAADDETEDLAMEFDLELHHLEEQPSIDVPPTLALDVHLAIEELQETIQDNEEIELIIDLFSMNDLIVNAKVLYEVLCLNHSPYFLSDCR
ncbi:hypothetical protein L7F22_023170 [Adiantum nelumboides]|nr:hypothetical protein [Adiantum nelumboides]